MKLIRIENGVGVRGRGKKVQWEKKGEGGIRSREKAAELSRGLINVVLCKPDCSPKSYIHQEALDV